MRAPRNLRVVRSDPAGRFCDVQFDGDPAHNGYRLWVRPASDLPREDLPHGRQQYVRTDNPNHPIWPQLDFKRGTVIHTPPRRTWTSYGGIDRGTGRSRTQAGTPIPVVATELDGDGPWQIVAVDRDRTEADPPDDMYSNMVVWPAPILVRPPEPPPAPELTVEPVLRPEVTSAERLAKQVAELVEPTTRQGRRKRRRAERRQRRRMRRSRK